MQKTSWYCSKLQSTTKFAKMWDLNITKGKTRVLGALEEGTLGLRGVGPPV